MNSYEQRQEERRERYEAKAAAARTESAQYRQRADQISGFIPMGQPILVGHHSEKRHRRDLDRLHTLAGKEFGAMDKAKHYAEKAASVGTGGVSSDDPDAVGKLREDLEAREQRQSHMKAVNAAFKRGGVDALSDEERAKWLRLKSICSYEDRPYPAYALSNNNAQIRRIKERMAELEARTGQADEVLHESQDFICRTDTTENRVMFEFPGKPDEETRGLLKSSGFKWSRSRMAWVRMLNNAGVNAARYVIGKLAA